MLAYASAGLLSDASRHKLPREIKSDFILGMGTFAEFAKLRICAAWTLTSWELAF